MKKRIFSILVLVIVLLFSVALIYAEGEVIGGDTPNPNPVDGPILGGMGKVMVISSPGNADIFVEGDYKGKTSSGSTAAPEIEIAANKPTEFRLSLPEYQDYITTMSVGQNEEKTLNVNLVPVPKKGSIQVTSVPGAADVYVDGSYRGKTSGGSTAPLVISDIEASTTHTLQVKKQSYLDYSITFSVNSGELRKFDVNLAPSTTGTISVSSVPSGARINLDGTYTGQITPAVLNNVAIGRHLVVLNLEGYNPWSGNVDVSSSQISNVNAQLNVAPAGYASLSITSKPDKADVYVDETYMGKTPGIFNNIRGGQHKVVVRAEGYNDYVSYPQFKLGSITTISAVLTPAPNNQEKKENNPVIIVNPEQNSKVGSVTANSEPAGADVYIDDVYEGITPLTIKNLEPGSHIIKVASMGYKDFTQAISIRENQDTPFNAVLVKNTKNIIYGTLGVLAAMAVILGAWFLNKRNK